MFAMAQEFNSDLSAWAVGNVGDMSGMFLQAASFRQNLCPWGTLVSPETDVLGMFIDTSCPVLSSPSLTANPIGPFCFAC